MESLVAQNALKVFDACKALITVFVPANQMAYFTGQIVITVGRDMRNRCEMPVSIKVITLASLDRLGLLAIYSFTGNRRHKVVLYKLISM